MKNSFQTKQEGATWNDNLNKYQGESRTGDVTKSGVSHACSCDVMV